MLLKTEKSQIFFHSYKSTNEYQTKKNPLNKRNGVKQKTTLQTGKEQLTVIEISDL